MMHVLITGGTGFIGSRLALRCLAQGHVVTVLGQENTPAEEANSHSLQAQGANVVVGSVTDRERLLSVMHDIDLVYHLAAAQHEAHVPDRYFWEVNVTGTRNLLEVSAEAGVRRFVHGSTIGVYGTALAGTLDESSPVQPDNIYGRTKLEGEKLVLTFQDRLPVVIIRISETYGPGDRRLLKLFKAIRNNVFFMIGNGRNIHHPIYIEDLLDGLVLASTVADAPGQMFVLAGKEALTTNDMVAVIAEQLGARLRAFRVPLAPVLGVAMLLEKSCRPLGVQPPLHRRRMDFFRKSFMFSYEKAASILKFSPRWSFKEGVEETEKWYRSLGYI
jgi:nucleoside-diphosphate-sugar epimerase